MPLAHIIAPQLAKKAREIEADLGHTPTGYLEATPGPALLESDDPKVNDWMMRKDSEYQRAGASPEQRAKWGEYNRKRFESFQMQSAPAKPAKPVRKGYIEAGYEKTPYDPRGLMNKPESKTYDPKDMMMGGGMQNALGAFQRSGDPRQQAFAKGALLGMDDKFMKGYLRKPHMPAVSAEPKKTKSGKIVLDAKPGEPIGIAEDGQAVDIKGRKLGFLNQASMVTRYGDMPMRTSERNAGDITEADRDPFALSAIEKKYGKHLDEVEFNNGKFPPGYFKGMKAEEKENIQKGVQMLMKQRREEKKGMPMT